MLGPRRRLKVRCTAKLDSYRGQHARTTISRQVYAINPEQQSQRVIDADLVHPDAQDFWLEKQWFYRKTAVAPLVQSWNRFAQTVILMTRQTERLVPEAAFRLLAVFLKVMMQTRIAETAAIMLPIWQSVNAENALGVAVSEGKKPEDNAATAAAAAPPPAGDQPPKAE